MAWTIYDENDQKICEGIEIEHSQIEDIVETNTMLEGRIRISRGTHGIAKFNRSRKKSPTSTGGG